MERLIVVGIVAILLIGVWEVKDQREKRLAWYKFQSEHSCKVVAKKDASTQTGWGVGSNGKSGVIFTDVPGQTAYLCDDGVTYWKEI